MRTEHELHEHERRLRELRPLGLGGLLFPSAPGCAGSRASSAAPSPCGREVMLAADRWYPMPRPGSWARLLLCDLHARLVDGAGPMTDEDVATLEARLREAAYWRGVVEANRERGRDDGM